MEKLPGNIIQSLEDIIRYLIPGAAFFILFSISYPDVYCCTLKAIFRDNFFISFMLLLTAGVTISVIHYSIIRFTLEQFTCWIKWSPVNVFMEGSCCPFFKKEDYLTTLAELNIRREEWSDPDRKHHPKYPAKYYRILWAMVHYLFILGELLWVFYFFHSDNSYVYKNHQYAWWTVTIFILVISIFSYFYMQKLERDTTQYLNTFS